MPSPPHASTPSPRAKAVRATSSPISAVGVTWMSTARAASASPSRVPTVVRRRRRPALALTTAVHCTAPDTTGLACALVAHGIDPARMPRHVAIVMDGNGRWAQRRGLKRTDGHAAGEEALFDTVEGALEIGLQWMTVYAFSTENWRRPLDEVRFLMRFNESLAAAAARRPERARACGCASSAGAADGCPSRVRQHIADTEALTAKNRRMTLTFAFNYGGRAELVDAVRDIAGEAQRGKLRPGSIDERTIARHLYAPDMPDPDVLVRTSGEYRISNYLLWELAYSELVFTDVLWPDFRREDLFAAIREYQGRSRRFGAIEEDD